MTDAQSLVQSSSGMLHVDGCAHIAHYVDGRREKITYDQEVVHDLRRIDSQTELIRTTMSDTVDKRWVNARVFVDHLDEIGPYSRCRHCAPDVPEYTPPTRYVSKESGALTHKDIGRESTAGLIVGVRHVAGGVEVEFSDTSVRAYAPTDRMEFAVLPRRQQPVDGASKSSDRG